MAIEDASGHNLDHTENRESVDVPVVQSFFDRFKDRFQSGETPWARLLSGESDRNDEDEDDDEVLESGDGVVRKKRGKLFEGLRSFILPKPEKIPGESGGRAESSLHDEGTVFSRYESLNVLGDSNVAQSEGVAIPHGHATDAIRDNERVTGAGRGGEELSANTPDSGVEMSSNDTVPIFDSAENQDSEQDMTTRGAIPDVLSPQQIAPVESVDQIIQRQRLGADLLTADMGQVGVNQSNPNLMTPQYVVDTKRPPTAGLVALDVLNYGVAKHRDKKIDRASQERDKRLEQQQTKQQQEFTQRLNAQEAVNQQLKARLELQEKQQKANLPRVRNAELRSRFTDEKMANIDKVTTKTHHNSPNNIAEATLTNEHNIVRAPDGALPSAEAVLHQVEKAAEQNVPIESLYEMRHERKGNENYSTLATDVAQDNIAKLQDALVRQEKENSQMALEMKQRGNLQDREQIYKQVATTGVFGAAVGAVLFIILYILTR